MAVTTTKSMGMKYRFLGDSGLLVSALSFGCMTFTSDDLVDDANTILAHAFKHGINYWEPLLKESRPRCRACEIADRLGLIRPIAEQPQYNLFHRARVEVDYAVVYTKRNISLTTFSPLAYSVLTGKYARGIPADARLAHAEYTTFVPAFETRVRQAETLRPIADQLNCSLAQLAIAWCASNPHVSSVILGASSVAQLDENLKAIDVVERLTPAIQRQIDALVPLDVANRPPLDTRYSTMRDQYLT